ncbi:mechanosensitive ion channel family protein [Paenibacillus marinisediminis]
MKSWYIATAGDTDQTIEESVEQTLTVLDKWKDEFMVWLDNTWESLLIGALQILLIFLITRVVIRIVHRMINHAMKAKEQDRISVNPRRLITIGKLLKNVTSLAMNFVMILLILSVFNIDLAPLIAGASVIGLAVSFGAQSLVKDVMTGFFIIFEDQFAVGDVIKVGQFQGTVEMIGLRSTRIHSWTGEVFIIPNGSITEVTNFSLNNSIAVIDVGIAYEENIENATKVIEKTLMSIQDQETNITKVPQVLGVQTLGPSQVVIRIIAECRPNTQASVSRKLNQIIKRSLDENDIEMPYPRMVTYHRQEKGGV